MSSIVIFLNSRGNLGIAPDDSCVRGVINGLLGEGYFCFTSEFSILFFCAVGVLTAFF